jgi:hypothetical protein
LQGEFEEERRPSSYIDLSKRSLFLSNTPRKNLLVLYHVKLIDENRVSLIIFSLLMEKLNNLVSVGKN